MALAFQCACACLCFCGQCVCVCLLPLPGSSPRSGGTELPGGESDLARTLGQWARDMGSNRKPRQDSHIPNPGIRPVSGCGSVSPGGSCLPSPEVCDSQLCLPCPWRRSFCLDPGRGRGELRTMHPRSQVCLGRRFRPCARKDQLNKVSRLFWGPHRDPSEPVGSQTPLMVPFSLKFRVAGVGF